MIELEEALRKACATFLIQGPKGLCLFGLTLFDHITVTSLSDEVWACTLASTLTHIREGGLGSRAAEPDTLYLVFFILEQALRRNRAMVIQDYTHQLAQNREVMDTSSQNADTAIEKRSKLFAILGISALFYKISGQEFLIGKTVPYTPRHGQLLNALFRTNCLDTPSDADEHMTQTLFSELKKVYSELRQTAFESTVQQPWHATSLETDPSHARFTDTHRYPATMAYLKSLLTQKASFDIALLGPGIQGDAVPLLQNVLDVYSHHLGTVTVIDSSPQVIHASEKTLLNTLSFKGLCADFKDIPSGLVLIPESQDMILMTNSFMYPANDFICTLEGGKPITLFLSILQGLKHGGKLLMGVSDLSTLIGLTCTHDLGRLKALSLLVPPAEAFTLGEVLFIQDGNADIHLNTELAMLTSVVSITILRKTSLRF